MTRALSARMCSIKDIRRLRVFAGAGKSGPVLPKGVAGSPGTVGGVGGEWIRPPDCPPDAAILYLHGGAWTLGWYDSHRRLVGQLCRDSGLAAFAADYRLAPEHPFPAAPEDCLAAYRGLLASGIPASRLALAGDSAGGNLVLATLMAARDSGDPLPAAAVCISPMIDLLATGESFGAGGDALLDAGFAMENVRRYLGGADPRDPRASPYYGDLSGLPPLLVQAGGDEILLSDARRLEAMARAAGVQAELSVWPGMWHVWHTFAPWMKEAADAIAQAASFIRSRIG